MSQSVLHRLYRSRACFWLRPIWRGLKRLRRATLDYCYYPAVDLVRGGTLVSVAGHQVRLDARTATLWNAPPGYDEVPAFVAFLDWCRGHPTGLVLDVGCEVGKYTVFAVHESDVSVVAFDSDTGGLRAVGAAVSWLARRDRVRLVYGFVTDSGDGANIDEATARTESHIKSESAPSIQNKFVCLGDTGTDAVPRYSISDLFRGLPPGRPVLIKIDVEGAEGCVLAGANAFLAAHRPTVLLSLHPDMVGRFGTTAQEVLSGLRALGYETRLLGVDHEEHWWCQPAAGSPPAPGAGAGGA